MLSPGAIAGIVIGSIVGPIILVAGLVYFFLKRRKAADVPATIHHSAPPVPTYEPPPAPPEPPVSATPDLTPVVPVVDTGVSVQHNGNSYPHRLPTPHHYKPYVPIVRPQDGSELDHSLSQSWSPAQLEEVILQEDSIGNGGRWEWGDGPVNQGSMSVKGIRDMGDQEEGEASGSSRSKFLDGFWVV